MGAIKRLIQYIDYKGITKYKFYKDTGLSNGFLDKNSNIGSDKCEKISYTYSDLNIEWLIMGYGPMLKEDKIGRASVNQENNIDYKELAESRKEIIELQKEKIVRLEKDMEDLKKQYRLLLQVQRKHQN